MIAPVDLDPVFAEHYDQYGVHVTFRFDPDVFRLRVVNRTSPAGFMAYEYGAYAAEWLSGDESDLRQLFVDADSMIIRLQLTNGVAPGFKRFSISDCAPGNAHVSMIGDP